MNPNEVPTATDWKAPSRYGELIKRWFESIVYCLHAERMWPDKEFMTEDKDHGSSRPHCQRNPRNGRNATL